MRVLSEGSEVGSFRIVAEVGRGGMATVYRAYQPSLDRFVAVKVLRDSDASDATFRERFRREARTIARLQHANIIQVFDFGEQDDLAYIVMEFVEGTTLRERMSGPLPARQAVDVIAQVASALDYAHANRVVHRDVKPGNVLLDAQGRAMLGDFGIARIMQAKTELTREQSSLGTPEYMSPEQAAAELVGPASDIYSLGVVAYQLLVGQVPFHADTAVAVLHAHIYNPPPLPSTINPRLPKALDAVLARALAKRPSERFHTATELALGLQDALHGGPEAQTALTVPVSAETPRRSGSKTYALAGVAVAVAALLAAGVALKPFSRVAVAPPAVAALSASGTVSASGVPAPSPASAGAASPAALVSAAPSASLSSNAAAVQPSPSVSPTPFPATAPTAIAVGQNPSIHEMTSSDGVHFGNDVPLGNAQGHLLSALSLGPSVRIYAADTQTLRLHSWKSDAQGEWQPEPAQVQGAPAGILYGCVVSLADGGFRLYYLPQNGPDSLNTGVRDVLSARSSDGIHFVQEPGARFSREGMTTVTVTPVASGWLMLFRQKDLQLLAGARSTDGMQFTPDANIALQAPSGVQVTSYDGQFHFLQYRIATGKVEELKSQNGSIWTLGDFIDAKFRDGTGPSPSLVIKDSGGHYRMFFSWVSVPGAATPTPKP